MENIFDIVSKFFSAFIMMGVIIYVWHKLLKLKINFKSLKLYLAVFVLSIISILNYYVVNSFIRMAIITIVFVIFIKSIFKISLKESIVAGIFCELLMIVSESVFGIFLGMVLKFNASQIIATQFGSFYANVVISLVAIILINFKFIINIYNWINSIIDKLNEMHIIIMSLFVIIIINILEAIIYYNISYYYLLIFNTLLILFCFIVVLNSFRNKNNYVKVYDKYNTTLNSLKEYEDILDRYRVSNHENKNQLLTIRNMIPKSDKKTISYIDKIVENKLKDNDKVMFEVSIIPAGGLRGLIYSKVLTMKNLKINYELEISNSVKTVDLISLDDSLMLDICQVIGVYLDNAIEEVKKLEEKYINIEMYTGEKELIIEISNNYKGKIDIEKIEEKGYTSKGKSHGYGLTLTKEIIDKNKKLSNEKKISKESFTQVLKIKM